MCSPIKIAPTIYLYKTTAKTAAARRIRYQTKTLKLLRLTKRNRNLIAAKPEIAAARKPATSAAEIPVKSRIATSPAPKMIGPESKKENRVAAISGFAAIKFLLRFV